MAQAELPPVSITLTAQWSSGNTVMNVKLDFAAQSVDDALRLVKKATMMAPIFRDPDHPEED